MALTPVEDIPCKSFPMGPIHKENKVPAKPGHGIAPPAVESSAEAFVRVAAPMKPVETISSEPHPPVTDALIAEMVEILVREADPEQVILFGSRGRGDARGDSDVDLIVVEEEPFGPGRDRVKEMARLYRALADFTVPTDILVYSTADVDYWRDSLNHVLARALRDGKVVYERP